MPRKPLVAIVDDNESIRETTKDLLESAGLDVATFASAEDFLDSAPLPDLSCAVADMRMSGMTGLALHAHLLAAGKSVPIILMTAYPDERTRARALETGVVAYLAKPFTDAELLGCIGAAVRERSS